MTTVADSPKSEVSPASTSGSVSGGELAAALDRFASPVPVANAALVGVPTFLVGSIALALNLTNYVSQGVVGAPIAIIAAATALGQLIATLSALKAGESAVASIFGIFTGFWLSYAVLVEGLLHNWFALGTSGTATVKTFLLPWLVMIVLLTLASLRLPLAFTVLFVLIDLALLFVYLAYVNTDAAGAASATQLKIGGGFVWAFVLVGAYLFLDAMAAATGGKNLPLGKAVLH